MKTVTRIFVVALFVVVGATASAQTAITKAGYAACQTEELLDNFIRFANANDTGSIKAYIDSRRCINLREGLTVTIIGTSGLLGSKVRFAYQGVELWTVREALDRQR